MPLQSQTQRSLLMGFIASFACCGLVGVYCLLIGQLGYYEERVLGTTAIVGAASILGLASAVPWERRRWHPLGAVGMLAVAVATVLVLVVIWFDPGKEGLYKTTSVAWVAGVALPHVGLLSLARLRRAYEWVRYGTVVCIAVLTFLVSLAILTESGDDSFIRLMGIIAIAVVCGTVAVPVLHRVSAIQTREAVRTTELKLSVTCPRCDKTQVLPAGRSKCGQCGLKFVIDIEEEHCGTCGYPLYRLESATCPECGTPIAGNRQPFDRDGSC